MTHHTPENCPINERVDRLEKQHHRHRRMGEVFFDSDMVATRVLLAIAELLWGVNLLLPGDTFDRPTYTIMAHFAVEEVWALVFLLTSWMQWNIVVIGDCKSIYARFFAAWNSFLWVFINVAMYLSVTPPPAAISGETALAIGATWVLVGPWVECIVGKWVTWRKQMRRLVHG